MLLAIDPGQTSGWALFNSDDCLVKCGLGEPVLEPFALWLVTDVYIERPRIYPGGRTKNPNDVLSVAINAGEWGGRYRDELTTIHYVEPAKWKRGSVKKDIQHARDWAKLTPDEQAIVTAAGKGMAPSKRHNMLDAVGIGLFAVGR